MSAHLCYLSYVVRHKWFVFRAGLKVGAPLWRLLIHDWSKFTLAEWFPYVQTFYGRDASYYRDAGRRGVWLRLPRGYGQEAFDKAWLHHQHRNPHHWQHWLLQEDDGDLKTLRMPHKLVREMVADWMGAGRAITGKWDVGSWYDANAHKIRLHPEVRQQVENLVNNHGRSVAGGHAKSGPEERG